MTAPGFLDVIIHIIVQNETVVPYENMQLAGRMIELIIR